MHSRTRILLFLLLLGYTPGFYCHAQEATTEKPNPTSMEPILEKSANLLLSIEEQGYEVVHLEVDILKTVRYTYRSLYPDYEYGLLIFGDYRLKSVQLKVYQNLDGAWAPITGLKTEQQNGNTLVTFKPQAYGKYRFEWIGEAFVAEQTAGHAGLLIFH